MQLVEGLFAKQLKADRNIDRHVWASAKAAQVLRLGLTAGGGAGG